MAASTTLKDRIVSVIDKLGNYVHLDLRYYIRNISFLTFAQVVTVGCGVLSSVAFARLMPKEVYGQYNYILAIIGALAIFSLPGMNTAIAQAVARGHDRVLVEGTKERFKWSVLGSIALFGVGIYYFLNDSTLLGKSFMISSLVFPFFENFQTYGAFLSGKKQFGKAAKYEAIAKVISTSVTVLVIYFSRNLLLILAAYLVSFSLVRAYFFKLTAGNMKNESNDEGAIPFGKKMTGVNALGVISGQGDMIIVGALLGFSELAIYAIARGFQGITRALMGYIAGLSMPKLAVMKEKQAYAAVKKRYGYLVLVTAIVAGISITLSPYLIPFVYSQQYAESVLYAQILLASSIFGTPTLIFLKALFPAQRKVKEILQLEIAHIVFRTGILIVLILNFGLLGLVLTKLITALFIMVYSWWQAGWIGPKSPPSPS